MIIGTIPDIPKIYTALAEWLSCVMYIILYRKNIKHKYYGIILFLILILLICLQVLIGVLPTTYWLIGMMMAVGIMYACIKSCCDFTKIAAAYCCIRAFALAEFAASLEWQVYYFFIGQTDNYDLRFNIFFLIVTFAIVYYFGYLIELKQLPSDLADRHNVVTKREFLTAGAITLASFTLSNLSYVYTNTPFSSTVATEVFNIRTLVSLGGFAFLYANNSLRYETQMQVEMNAIQNLFRNQYAQYRQSQNSIDIINRKYHDLKHEISILRTVTDINQRNIYLNEMEKELQSYESQYETGNPVIDTILAGKGLNCLKYGINLTCVVDGTLLNSIYVMDLCTMFGNALDNAIESVVNIADKEKRLIHVTVSTINTFILIRFENYFEGDLVVNDHLPTTTKEDKNYHGYGLKSIQYIAKKYGGYITISTQNQWFELKILIPSKGLDLDQSQSSSIN